MADLGLIFMIHKLVLIFLEVVHSSRWTSHHGVVLFRLIALGADAAAELVGTKPVFLSSNHTAQVDTIVIDHAIVTVLFRARLRLKVLVATKDSLLALA